MDQKKKRTRRGGRRKKKMTAPQGLMQSVDPQPMAGSVDPLNRKAMLVQYIKAKQAGKSASTTAMPLTQNGGING